MKNVRKHLMKDTDLPPIKLGNQKRDHVRDCLRFIIRLENTNASIIEENLKLLAQIAIPW